MKFSFILLDIHEVFVKGNNQKKRTPASRNENSRKQGESTKKATQGKNQKAAPKKSTSRDTQTTPKKATQGRKTTHRKTATPKNQRTSHAQHEQTSHEQAHGSTQYGDSQNSFAHTLDKHIIFDAPPNPIFPIPTELKPVQRVEIIDNSNPEDITHSRRPAKGFKPEASLPAKGFKSETTAMLSTDDFNSDNLSLQPIEGFKPEILAPAGDTASFLAGLSAGADAVYVGLKHFSARAGADNFSMTDLSRMVNLANEHGKRVNIAFNSLVKPDDILPAARLMKRLARDAKPNAIIIQDPGLIDIARQAGFQGEIHLSTLANITHQKALENAASLGVDRVILPREINIDEIRLVAQSCPTNISLELFVHGALCYCVSGRCYWSSYMGGKSGLRGRCVQPCRRVYKQKSKEGRYFSCQDLSLDVLVKSLLSIPQVNCWKIEGRKKGPHYVYHTVMAYTLLRDEGPSAKKEALALLDMALGRPRTHGIFLPQNGQNVTAPEENTGSGLLVGKIQFDVVTPPKDPLKKGSKKNTIDTRQNISAPYFKPRISLLSKDLLRIGYEDDPWYATMPVTRSTPKAGSYTLRIPRHKTPKAGTPVFLIDRREADLMRELSIWQRKLEKTPAVQSSEVTCDVHLPKPSTSRHLFDIRVRTSLPQGKETRAARSSLTGLWLTPSTMRAISKTLAPRISWWLPPVIWPNEEATWQRTILEAIRNGATHFVCNEPWQIAFFQEHTKFAQQHLDAFNEAQNASTQIIRKNAPNSPSHKAKVPKGGKKNIDRNATLSLIAGPFCNIANAATIALMKNMGFMAAIVSPELSRDDFLVLPKQSALPLGFVLDGFWPVGISRHNPLYLKNNIPFQSPKGEQFWTRQYGQNLWIYPSWPLDLSNRRHELEHAGYNFFVHLEEHCPEQQERQDSEFNWNIPLL